MASIARETLARARFFWGEAVNTGGSDLHRFKYQLEAAIIFGRHALYSLASENKPNWEAWWKQHRLHNDPLLKFMIDQRNSYVHAGRTAEVGRTVSLSFRADALVVSPDDGTPGPIARGTVIRGQPLYRRRPRIILEDVKDAILGPVRWKWARFNRERRRRASKPTAGQATEGVYFRDPTWTARTATDLVDEFHTKLENVVGDAERQFGL